LGCSYPSGPVINVVISVIDSLLSSYLKGMNGGHIRSAGGRKLMNRMEMIKAILDKQTINLINYVVDRRLALGEKLSRMTDEELKEYYGAS
jgi:hypothetical protein